MEISNQQRNWFLSFVVRPSTIFANGGSQKQLLDCLKCAPTVVRTPDWQPSSRLRQKERPNLLIDRCVGGEQSGTPACPCFTYFHETAVQKARCQRVLFIASAKTSAHCSTTARRSEQQSISARGPLGPLVDLLDGIVQRQPRHSVLSIRKE